MTAIAEPIKSERTELTLTTEPLARDLQDFLARYGKALAGTAERKLVPLHRPGIDAAPDLERIELHRSKMQGKRFQFFPSQKEKIAGAVQGLKNHSSVMFICEMGCGKAQPLRCKILTPTGWTTMGEVKVGDKLIDPDGGVCEVLGKFPQGKKKVYRVVFNDHSMTWCCEEHLWSVNTATRRFRGGSDRVLSLKQILDEGLIRGKNHKHFIPICQPADFPSRDILIDPYVMGLLIGDGCFRHNTPTFSSEDKDIIDGLKKSVAKLGMKVLQHGTSCDYRISNARNVGTKRWHWTEKRNPINEAIKHYGLHGHYSYEKFIPEDYLWNSFENRVSLLQGLLDTDGTCRKAFLEYSTSSQKLARNVVQLVQSLGGIATTGFKMPKYTHNGEDRIGRLNYRVHIKLPPNIAPFRCARKLARYTPLTKYTSYRAIHFIEQEPNEEETCCIMVSSKRNLYVTDDFVVTHNTVLSLAASHVMARGQNFRAIIMCPGHLVHKWVREAQWLIPNVYARPVKLVGDLMKFRAEAERHNGPAIAVIGKEAAKLGCEMEAPIAAGKRKQVAVHIAEREFAKKGDMNLRANRVPNKWGHYYDNGWLVDRIVDVAMCPRCSTELTTNVDGDDVPYRLDDYLRAKNYEVCKYCGEKLTTWRRTDRAGIGERPHVDRYIQRKMKNWFDFFIADEVHELASATTCQGNTFGTLAAACRYTIALTGTLIGGKASDLHATLWRLCPDLMRARGFDLAAFRQSRIGPIARNTQNFTHKYGVTEYKVERSAADDYRGRIRRGRQGRKKDFRADATPKPGISPHLFNHFLLDRAVFMSLEELGPALPRLERELVPVEPGAELARAYRSLDGQLTAAIKEGGGHGRKAPPMLAGMRVQILDAYLDRPWGWEPITVPSKYDDEGDGFGDKVVAVPEDLGVNHLDTKDAKLLAVIRRELAFGRKCTVFVTYTQKRDAQEKLQRMLHSQAIRSVILPSSLAPIKREEWIEKNERNIDVLIVQPRKVMTGLDLIQFPTLIWYQTGYSTHVLRQASARARRPIQTKDCKVIFLYYKGTIQEQALALMGEKEAASQALEGTFDTRALRALMNGGKDDDILSALANSLDRREAKAAWSKLVEPELKEVRSPFVSVLSAAFSRKTAKPSEGVYIPPQTVKLGSFFRRK